MRLIKFCLKYQYDLLIFAFLTFQLFLMMPSAEHMHVWITTPYALNYTYGFASRLLVGSFINLLTPYLSVRFLWLFILIFTILLCLLLSLFFGSCIRANSEKNAVQKKCSRLSISLRLEEVNIALITLIALYLASPASVAYLFNSANFGRMDIYLFIFSLLSLFCIRHRTLKFLVPVLGLLSIATHQVFMFTYFPLILGILLYYLYENDFNKKSMLFFFCTLSVFSIAFIYFQFFSSINMGSADEVIESIQHRSNIPITKTMIEAEYFWNISEHRPWFINIDRAVRGLIALCLMVPFHFFLIHIYWQAIKHCNERTLKIIFMLIICLPVLSVPAFALTVDWGRWFAALYTVQLLIILYLAKIKCMPMITALENLAQRIQKHFLVVLLLILYLTLLGKFECVAVLSSANRIEAGFQFFVSLF